MKTITLEALLEAGCHFGHQITRHNPKSRDFIFEARDNIHIIDLVKTKEGLDTAAVFLRNLAQKNGILIIVGTKRQAQPIIEEEIKRVQEVIKETKVSKETEAIKSTRDAGLLFVTKRWIGGTLTNFAELEKNLKKLKEITTKLKDENEKIKYTKKELGLLDKERQKLESFYAGLTGMKKHPDALLIIDTHIEHLAVREARQTHVPTVGIVDTNSDPYIIDYPIPANDDAVGSIKIILHHLMDAWIEGKTKEETKAPKETDEASISAKATADKKVKETKSKSKDKKGEL